MLLVSICAALLAATPNPHLAQAETLVSSVRYADAEKALAAAWASRGNSRETVLRILELRGIVNAVLGQPKASEYFRQLLTLDPGRKLAEGQPPRVRTPFYEAKGQVTESAPMKLSGAGMVEGATVKLSAQLTADPLKLGRKVRFHVRSGGRPWKPADVPLAGLTATFDAGPGKVEWWAELLGEQDGALLAFLGPELPGVAQAAELKVPVVEGAVDGPAPVPEVVEGVEAPAPSRPLLIPGLLVGAGVAAAGAGIALGLMSRGSYAQVDSAPKDATGTVVTLTQRQAAAARDAGRTQAVVANVLFGSAVALAGAGVVVFLLDGPGPIAIAPSPNGVVFAGDF